MDDHPIVPYFYLSTWDVNITLILDAEESNISNIRWKDSYFSDFWLADSSWRENISVYMSDCQSLGVCNI